ncbi:thioredoxin domain-containing protein 16-like isoform X1 [Bufo gargarizans]|uniref:thioredoxin domain-containing protein 16-like isoform X1 n=1 Tax=Bufo gargarizans TaxID=30331 RepID=UPI001CF52F13|nr:thioredoxin domain-containing protein 16-like isoform X1 [Bufo gargarizans]XP_044132430.1 thioredoxin domain-containing protein 16-like isoform X1 [Bufo gargarizans]
MTAFSRFFLLLLYVNSFFRISAEHVLPELTTDDYSDSLAPGKSSLLYFSGSDRPGNVIFLEELQKSSSVLQDYGISVAKVRCVEEAALRFCAEDKAYLFRGSKLLREFPVDTLFDVNAIVANVLFVLLYNKVKYITSTLELQKLEDATKGKKNIVFTYVRAIGTPEHRYVMEAAFAHGSTHQFVVTTESNVLKSMSPEDPSLISARLVFIHCKSVTRADQKCQRTLSDQPLTTIHIHRFLKLMGLPLVVEVSDDPDKFSSVHLQLGLPVIFILSQQETYEVDMETAKDVAWQLLGKAGVGVVQREKSGINIPVAYNVAVKRPDENSPVKYLKLKETQQILDLIHVSKEEQPEKPEESHGDPGVQDDEVARDVYRNRRPVLPLRLVPSLTDDTFKTVFSSARPTAVLFYMIWEHISITLLQFFQEVAEKYKGILEVSLAAVNCADWTVVCTEEKIRQFPSVRIYQAGQEPVLYQGMMGTDELARFLILFHLECPRQLHTVEEAEGFISGAMHTSLLPYHNTSILGLFTLDMKEGVAEDFIRAARHLRGSAVVGIYIGESASVLAQQYGTPPPAILFSRSSGQKVHAVSIHNAPADEILPLLKWEILGEFPEVTVESLPALMKRQKPLLILFSDGVPNPLTEKHILSLVRGKYLEQYVTCWLNVKNTPAGLPVLKTYFSVIPPLPQLVLISFDSQGQVFALPVDQQISEVSILYWLEMVKAGEEVPVYFLSKDDWGPPLPHYDFLAMMDEVDPNLAAQKIRIHMKSARSKKAELSTKEEKRQITSLRRTIPKFIDSEEESGHHEEL